MDGNRLVVAGGGRGIVKFISGMKKMFIYSGTTLYTKTYWSINFKEANFTDEI